MPITCPVFRRALQAIEKVDGMMIGEKTVQAGDAFLQHLEMTIQMISKKYRRIWWPPQVCHFQKRDDKGDDKENFTNVYAGILAVLCY